MRAFAVSDRYRNTSAVQNSVDGLAMAALSASPEPLDTTESAAANAAWAYFARTGDPVSGFSPASNRSAQIGPWEMGSTLHAILAAQRLGLVSGIEASRRISLCLSSLAGLPVGRTKLPGRAYHFETLSPVGSKAVLSGQVIGFSARQILRLVSGFIATAHHHGDLAPEIALILNRWNMRYLLKKNTLHSAVAGRNGREILRSEEWLGHEQYAARTASFIGMKAERAADIRPNLGAHKIGDIPAPCDKRRFGGKPAILTSDPFHLEAMEFGWRQDMLDVAASLLLCFRNRFERTGNLTAPGEDVLDKPPGKVIQGLRNSALPFASVDETGNDTQITWELSTKSAFGWWSLVPSPYAQKLLDGVSHLMTPNGWQSGVFEGNGKINTSISLNTNAAILQALHYKAQGPVFPAKGSA